MEENPKSCPQKILPPKAGGAWPIIGHLHLLGGTQPAHITLGDMADKNGPIFSIKLGMHRAIVVSSSKIAKECFTTNDKIFANRPKSLATELMGYNYAMFVFSPYGSYWRHVRRIATLEVLSNQRIEMLKHIRESEVNTAIKEIYELSTKNNNALVEMRRWFGYVTLNVVFMMVIKKRFAWAATKDENEGNDQCQNTMRDFFVLSGIFVAADVLPYLRWLDLGGYEKAMKKIAKKLDHELEGWLEEHKQRRISEGVKEGHQDFMDVMLSIVIDSEEISSYDADTITKATCLGLILAGTDTTTVTMTWALCLLLNNREALKKAQQELDLQIGRDRLVMESDVKNLVYLQAVIKETMRLYPAAPLSVPHESLEDCTLAGYHIPMGTRLLVNLSKIHRDPQVWSDPTEFCPERFLTTHKDVDFKGHHFELIPFGSGRRVCPGISFALQVMQLTLANFLHAFEIMTVPTDEPVDMTEKFGLTSLKATPLEVHLTPRLPSSAYA
ncbi:cytochrome P450 CYP82D47-like isoform X1 [Juglans microcarpa x Juglans regia]|uniref:cytochrome P450 CYP82D47-like isoform X1 n=1 Tax=Juglans microcarpa x Juglans regia TaxID=2249226 RepID=UPI001B7F4D5F|nr:cytochrome P450 CYP82D47-like isoform X1 [Juglans microcarpa x Juglans regia]